ncbi:MAG: KpsF/GutQ family sugar-phosphate isomerase [Burkholderiales bacterium]|nr:KpsF/GutQ family sugar-phosphate isomerase [Burkholderiales bacterium]
MTNLLQPHPVADSERFLELARRVLDIEADAVREVKARLGAEFLAAHRLILETKGRVVVTGMGKSGHIGHKIASTLASTGTPAFFMHPAEASHGDLGMITAEDVVLAISYSGESDEIGRILPLIKRRGAKVIAITGRADSTLAREADVHLDARIEKEACPLNLAPTASTTATLALGDALAVALLDARGFASDDFAQHHPGGALGRRLLVHVSDIMRKGEQIPRNRADDLLLPTALDEMSRKGIGMTCVVDANDRLLGIFTDGDLRRTLEKRDSVKGLTVGDVMKRDPITIGPERLAAEAAQVLEQKSLGGRLVVLSGEGKLVGAITFHDLLAAKVV